MERKRVLEIFYIQWNFAMNVTCDSNENICEATTINFPCKQTIMKLDINKFDLTQFECRIWNLINLLINCLVILNITNQLHHRFSEIFLKICTFSYGHLFLVSFFYQLTSEKNQVHTGDLTHCKQTLQLIKFHLIKYMKGNRGNWLAQFKFPFLSILWSFLLSYGKVYSFPHFTVFCLFARFPNNLNYCCQQIKCKEHIKCVQLVIL